MDFGGGDEAEGNQLGGVTVDRLSGIPHIISTNNFLSSEDSEEGEREGEENREESVEDNYQQEQIDLEAQFQEEEDYLENHYSADDVPEGRKGDSTFQVDIEEYEKESSEYYMDEVSEEKEPEEGNEQDGPVNVTEASFYTAAPGEAVEEFLEKKSVPAANLTEEKAILEKVAEKLKEFLEKQNLEPHNNTIFHVLLNGEVKVFSLHEVQEIKFGQEDEDTLLIEIHKKLFRAYNKTDEKKEKEFLEAAKRGEVILNCQRFKPRVFKFFYCAGHENYVFHTSCGGRCNHKESEGSQRCRLKVKFSSQTFMQIFQTQNQ